MGDDGIIRLFRRLLDLGLGKASDRLESDLQIAFTLRDGTKRSSSFKIQVPFLFFVVSRHGILCFDPRCSSQGPGSKNIAEHHQKADIEEKEIMLAQSLLDSW